MTEYVEKDLYWYLRHAGRLSNNQLLKVIRGLFEGIQEMHQNQVCHLDIKPGNILVDSDLNVKFCDFGLSRFFD